MLILCANTEAQFYALEELHEFLGIITNKPVYFVVEGSKFSSIKKDDFYRVILPPIKIEKHIPNKLKIHMESNSLYVEDNILGLIVQTLSRYEEHDKPKDKYGRITLNSTSAYKQGIYQTAYLDRLIDQFKIPFINYLNYHSIPWQQTAPWEKPLICLTHDADTIKGKSILRYAFWFLEALTTIKKKKIREALSRIKKFVSLKEDPHFSFQKFYEIENKYGFKSTFFIMSLPFFLGKEGRRYSLHNRKLKEATLKLIKNGWEIGLHCTRSANYSKKKFKKELFRLIEFLGEEEANIGVRSHYLNASFPETWRIQEELGIKYDSTLGWTESSGFRAGTARPFQPFDRDLNRRLGIWELPLIVMDGTLQGSIDDIFNSCKQMAAEAFQNNNPFTLLWHTDRISPIEYPDFSLIYPKLLKYFYEKDCLSLTANEIITIYKQYHEEMAKNRRRMKESNDV